MTPFPRQLAGIRRRCPSPRSSARPSLLVARYDGPRPGCPRAVLGRSLVVQRQPERAAPERRARLAGLDGRRWRRSSCSRRTTRSLGPLLVGVLGGDRPPGCAARGRMGMDRRSTPACSASRRWPRRSRYAPLSERSRPRCPARSASSCRRRCVYVVVGVVARSLLSYAIELAHVPARGSARSRAGRTRRRLPFALVGFLLGRLYLSLGAAVMLLIIVPILIAREMFASYIAREGVARRDRAAPHPRARAEGPVHRRSRRAGRGVRGLHRRRARLHAGPHGAPALRAR